MLTTGTPQTQTNEVSPQLLAVYDRRMLIRVVEEMVYDRYGQIRTIPANQNTKKGFARRYKNVLPATTPLAEYNGSNIKAPNKIVKEEIEYSVDHYGDYVVITDELNLYDFDNVQTEYLDILSDQAALTQEVIRRDALRAGTNVVYADSATSRLDLVDNSKKTTLNDLRLIALKLKNQRGKKFTKTIVGSTKIGTKPVRSGYICIASPAYVEHLRTLVGWKDVEEYSDFSKAEPGEVGSILDFRVIESNNEDPIVQTGTDTEDYNVHISLFMAMDAYATTTIRGKGGIMTKVKPIGSSGSSDPLDQVGTIGWKLITGCAIINEAWLIRHESLVDLEDGSVKHYYDFS